MPRIKLFYFMELIYFSKKEKLDLEKKFIFNVEKNLWFEAKQDFREIINDTFRDQQKSTLHVLSDENSRIKRLLTSFMRLDPNDPSEEDMIQFIYGKKKLLPFKKPNKADDARNNFLSISNGFKKSKEKAENQWKKL